MYFVFRISLFKITVKYKNCVDWILQFWEVRFRAHLQIQIYRRHMFQWNECKRLKSKFMSFFLCFFFFRVFTFLVPPLFSSILGWANSPPFRPLKYNLFFVEMLESPDEWKESWNIVFIQCTYCMLVSTQLYLPLKKQI